MSVNLLKTIKKIKLSFCKFLLFHLAFILKNLDPDRTKGTEYE